MKLTFVLFLALPLAVKSQSNYAPLNEDYYHWVDRYEIKTGRVLSPVFTTIKPYKRSGIVGLADSASSLGVFTSKVDRFNYTYLMNDNWEWSGDTTSISRKPVLKHFWKRKSDFFSFHNDDFDLHINPVIYFGLGSDKERTERLFINTRGIEVRGMIDRKVGFYTYLTDNQAVLPAYVWRPMLTYPVIPHEGFWKEFKSNQGVDFLQARGYITYDATKHIHLQLGHDRFFFGNGYRSLVFSDFAPPSMFLRANVKVWKVNYMFLLNQMTAGVVGNRGGLHAAPKGYPNKYVAFHHFSFNIGSKLNVGLFESVVFSNDDSTGSDYLRLDYFNPIIFYRGIEQQNGSTDNVLIGMDFKLNLVRNLQFYGQLMLDEFVLGNILEGNGWWANKFGIQAGGKYVDAFHVRNLDLQGEINIVRPYTYTHNSTFGNYSHYLQPIAHPLGANFREMIGIVKAQPVERLALTGKLILAQTGRDPAGENWGADILKDNAGHERNYGNTIGQGAKTSILFGSFHASWQLKHNLFIDATTLLRKSKSDLDAFDSNTTISSLALRWNIPLRHYEF